MNQNPTHQDVTNMLRDQWPASIEVGDANKEAEGKGGHDGSRGYDGHEGEVVEEQGKGSRDS